MQNFAEYELFTLLLKAVTPHFHKISSATLKNDCMSAYELEKKKIKALLASVDKVCLPTDLWKSEQNIEYMVMTCHFIDSNWKLQK